MSEIATEPHLSQLSTRWSLVYQAHGGTPQASLALETLLQRYAGAVRRYLRGPLRDPDAADDLFQEFSLRFVRGDFRRANADKGRFRDFIKTALFHLIVDHQKRRQRQPQPLSLEVADPVGTPPIADSEQQFQKSWREELITRTWASLAEVESQTGQPCHTVLRFRTDNQQLTSEELAARLAERLGRPFTVNAVRLALSRARARFADLLLAEVLQTLEEPTRERLEEELIDLGLQAYCRAALNRSLIR